MHHSRPSRIRLVVIIRPRVDALGTETVVGGSGEAALLKSSFYRDLPGSCGILKTSKVAFVLVGEAAEKSAIA